MRLKKQYLVFILIVTLLNNCDRPDCVNYNNVFDNYSPDAETYKAELKDVLESKANASYSYWLKDYKKLGEIEYLYFYIQGDGLCAVLPLEMQHWEKIEDLKEKKGAGRFNAEFKKLEFDIISDSLQTRFVYKTFDRIID